jgi:hypothetical protein
MSTELESMQPPGVRVTESLTNIEGVGWTTVSSVELISYEAIELNRKTLA